MLFSNKRPLVVWLTAASLNAFRKPGLRTFLSFYSCVTMGQESNFHSACSAILRMLLEQRWNLHNVVIRNVQKGGWTRQRTRAPKAVCHPKSEIIKSAFYQNLITRPGVKNFMWMLVAHTCQLCHTAFICLKQGRNQLFISGDNFHEISFDDVIVLIQPWYNFFTNGHR